MKAFSAMYPWDAHTQTLPFVDSFAQALLPKDIDTTDSFLILHGGRDVSPCVYNQKPHPKNMQQSSELHSRDELEINLARHCQEKGIPVFGICRGAQLMTCLSGGSLVQHVNGHNMQGLHKITFTDGTQMFCNSAHHQMMNLEGSDATLLAWSSKSLSDIYEGETPKHKIKIDKEPEVVYFPSFKGFGVQGHPEWMKVETEFVQFWLASITSCVEKRENAPSINAA